MRLVLHIVQADVQAVDTDGDGVLYYARNGRPGGWADVLAVLAEHGLK